MTIPVRIKGTTTRVNIDRAMIEYYATLPKVDVMQSDNNRWKWWELALVAAIVLAGIWALFATAEAQIVRGMV